MSAPSTALEAAPLRPIRQIRNTRTFYRFLFRKLGLPQPLCTAIVKGLKYAWNPAQIALRRRAAHGVVANAEIDHLKAKGYLLFDPQRFRGTDAAMSKVEEIFAASDVANGEFSDRNKDFLITIAENEEFLKWPQVFEFAASRDLLDIATRYFGRVPMLSNIAIWWSPPNDSLQQSQMFHSDRADSSILKFFFNVRDITQDMGPFHMIGADVSDRLRRDINYDKRKSSRVTDEEIAAHGAMEHCMSLEGQRCTGACVDTFRCLHYGSRGNKKGRLVLMVRFSDCLAPYADIPDWHAGLMAADYALDGVQRLALGLRP